MIRAEKKLSLSVAALMALVISIASCSSRQKLPVEVPVLPQPVETPGVYKVGVTSPEEFVSAFLKTMIQHKGSQNATEHLMRFMSYEYFRQKNIVYGTYKVDYFYPDRFRILKVQMPYVAAVVEGNQWAHILIFQVVAEGGYYYIFPTPSSYANYVKPWCNEKRNVNMSSQGEYTFPEQGMTVQYNPGVLPNEI